MGKRGECRVEPLGRTEFIASWFHNVMVMYVRRGPLVKPGSSDFFHPLVRYCRNRGPEVIVRVLTITVVSLLCLWGCSQSSVPTDTVPLMTSHFS
jgi:hypothetical protein